MPELLSNCLLDTIWPTRPSISSPAPLRLHERERAPQVSGPGTDPERSQTTLRVIYPRPIISEGRLGMALRRLKFPQALRAERSERIWSSFLVDTIRTITRSFRFIGISLIYSSNATVAPNAAKALSRINTPPSLATLLYLNIQYSAAYGIWKAGCCPVHIFGGAPPAVFNR